MRTVVVVLVLMLLGWPNDCNGGFTLEDATSILSGTSLSKDDQAKTAVVELLDKVKEIKLDSTKTSQQKTTAIAKAVDLAKTVITSPDANVIIAKVKEQISYRANLSNNWYKVNNDTKLSNFELAYVNWSDLSDSSKQEKTTLSYLGDDVKLTVRNLVDLLQSNNVKTILTNKPILLELKGKDNTTEGKQYYATYRGKKYHLIDYQRRSILFESRGGIAQKNYSVGTDFRKYYDGRNSSDWNFSSVFSTDGRYILHKGIAYKLFVEPEVKNGKTNIKKRYIETPTSNLKFEILFRGSNNSDKLFISNRNGISVNLNSGANNYVEANPLCDCSLVASNPTTELGQAAMAVCNKDAKDNDEGEYVPPRCNTSSSSRIFIKKKKGDEALSAEEQKSLRNTFAKFNMSNESGGCCALGGKREKNANSPLGGPYRCHGRGTFSGSSKNSPLYLDELLELLDNIYEKGVENEKYVLPGHEPFYID